MGLEQTTHRSGSNVLPTEPSRFPPEDHITPGPQQGGDLLPTGGIVCKEQPRHEKAIPMGPCVCVGGGGGGVHVFVVICGGGGVYTSRSFSIIFQYYLITLYQKYMFTAFQEE